MCDRECYVLHCGGFLNWFREVGNIFGKLYDDVFEVRSCFESNMSGWSLCLWDVYYRL